MTVKEKYPANDETFELICSSTTDEDIDSWIEATPSEIVFDKYLRFERLADTKQEQAKMAYFSYIYDEYKKEVISKLKEEAINEVNYGGYRFIKA